MDGVNQESAASNFETDKIIESGGTIYEWIGAKRRELEKGIKGKRMTNEAIFFIGLLVQFNNGNNRFPPA